MKNRCFLCAMIYCCITVITFIGCDNTTRKPVHSDSADFQIDDFVTDTSMLVDNAGVAFKTLISDTTKPLSYKGIVIGESVRSFLGNTIPKSSCVDTFGNYCKYSFRNTIQVDKKEYPTNVEVYCVNDTIVLLNVIVEPKDNNYSLHKELMELFSVKYGTTFNYLPSDYLMAFMDTIDHFSSSRDFDRYENSWYSLFHRYTYHFSVWVLGSQSVIVAREICNFEKFWDWDEEYDQPEWWSTNERVFLVYGDNVTFPKLVKGKLKLDYYNFQQKAIQDSIASEDKHRIDSIRSVDTKKRVLQEANQI